MAAMQGRDRGEDNRLNRQSAKRGTLGPCAVDPRRSDANMMDKNGCAVRRGRESNEKERRVEGDKDGCSSKEHLRTG
ncbi:C2 domain protein [Sesbania bispinosa]|nr:C2 domain protein [Sesbania bispinosa]